MKNSQKKQQVFLSGNEAIALGAWSAGVYFASAYPGTPSTEILETLSKFNDVQAQWAVNEKVAYEAAFGSCIAGKRALTACKHVGLNVAMDPLMTTVYSGVNAGFVIVVADDPGMHSSQNEQDTRLVAPYAKIPLLEPSSPSECYLFVKEAFNISERFDTPVLLRITTRVSHTKESFYVDKRREDFSKKRDKNPKKYVMIPGHAKVRHLDLEKRLKELKKFSEKTKLNKETITDTKTGFITSGVSSLYVKETYPNASILTLGMSFPFPAPKIRDFSKKVKKLYVIEELEPFLANRIKQEGIKIIEKDLSWHCGELNPSAVKEIIKGTPNIAVKSKNRRPLLCAGCPHRPTFYSLKKMGVYVTGDIGCYTLGALEPLAALHTQICMGASIPFFEGMGKAQEGEKTIAVIGDSTFIHTGINGLISAVYNGTKGVIVIMDNSITAMTGGQQNPATGLTLQGKKTKKLSIEAICIASGVDNVDIMDPYNINEFQALLKKRLDEKKLSVVIARSPCKMIDRSKKTTFKIKTEKCKECGQCVLLDCPAIQKINNKIEINENLCVGCGLCSQICKFKAIVESK